MAKWIHCWKRNGCETADEKPAKNVGLCQTLGDARYRRDITWQWVRGHATPENERANGRASASMAPSKTKR
ncbi:MAG: hypothetical protein JSS20_22270 [Proteobacteria bacterium]|nr:hypothetical protein [Pseudomonadota bacterium]